MLTMWSIIWQHLSKENLYLEVLEHAINKFKENITIKKEESDKKGIDYITEYFNDKFYFLGRIHYILKLLQIHY